MDFQEKKPISQKQREHLKRAREAAAAKRKERGGQLTPKQREAVDRMKAARAEKIAQKKAVQKGEINAPNIELENGVTIEPAKWPEKTKQVIKPEPVDQDFGSNNIEEFQHTKQKQQPQGDTWGVRLKRALGL